MKFTQLIAVASAVRLSKKGDGPTPADVMNECDTSGNGMLDKAEAVACIQAHIPEEHWAEAEAMMDKMWPMVDADGNGEVDEHELSEAMRGGPPKKLAKLMKGDGPTPADVIDHCDTSGNGMLDKAEAFDCMKDHIPEEHLEEAKAMMDEMWPMVDKDGNGEIDEHELSKAMRGGPPKDLAQLLKKKKKAAKELAQDDDEDDGEKKKKKKKGGKGKKGKKGGDSDSGSDSEGSGSEDEAEELVQKDKKKKKAAKELAQKGGKGPSPADVIDECDTSGNGMLDKAEVRACIAEHVPEEHQAEADAMVDEMWPHVDKDGNGEIDEHELSKAMRGGPPKLAQLMKKGKGGKGKGGKGKKGGDSDDDMPSPAEIMEECDTNEDGMMDADEAHACIDAHITDPEMNAEAHAMVDEGFAEHGPMSKEDIEHEMEEMEEGDGPKGGKGSGPAALADKKKKKKKAAKEEEELAQKDKKKKKAAKELALRRKKAKKE